MTSPTGCEWVLERFSAVRRPVIVRCPTEGRTSHKRPDGSRCRLRYAGRSPLRELWVRRGPSVRSRARQAPDNSRAAVVGRVQNPTKRAASATDFRSDTTVFAGNDSSGQPIATAFMIT